jgi:elongation factor 4
MNGFSRMKMMSLLLRSHGMRVSISLWNKPIASYSTKLIDLSEYPPDKIRNFSIIAHIDHGKSTLADRLLESSGTISKKEKEKNMQVLDSLKVERERGITVKAQTASMLYTHSDGQKYLLNLIDTPGHSDFSYEVSRSLAACQGTLLLVDATQGIQAQTIANFYLAFGQDLSIVPVINKIDLPSANVDRVKREIESTFELETDDAKCISAKTGLGVEDLFPEIIEKIPAPMGDAKKPFRALLFDTWYDKYAGVVCLIAVKDGSIKKGERIMSAYTKLVYEINDIGIMYPNKQSTAGLFAGIFICY